MYILTKAASKDIEKLLDRSTIDFGLEQTEIYFDSLKNCLMLLSENPAMGIAINWTPTAIQTEKRIENSRLVLALSSIYVRVSG